MVDLNLLHKRDKEESKEFLFFDDINDRDIFNDRQQRIINLAKNILTLSNSDRIYLKFLAKKQIALDEIINEETNSILRSLNRRIPSHIFLNKCANIRADYNKDYKYPF